MNKVAIRCDGSKSIGMGHVMRCLSLASHLKTKQVSVVFISRYSEGIAKIKETGYEVFELINNDVDRDVNSYLYKVNDLNTETNKNLYEDLYKGEYKNKHEKIGAMKNNEIGAISEIIINQRIQCLIVDRYDINYEYLFDLRKIVKLAYVDDLNSFIYPVDFIINGNVNATELGYSAFDKDTTLLLGISYNMIRKEFQEIEKRNLNREVESIMITTGGSDAKGVTEKLLNYLTEKDEFAELKINVVVGSAFLNKEKIFEIEKQHKNITIYDNPSKMSEIMLASDIAISSGGSTLYELCACGTPTLAITIADNQKGITKKLDDLGLILSLGCWEDLSEDVFMNQLNRLLRDYETRKHMSENGQKLVDGNGCARIVDALLKT